MSSTAPDTLEAAPGHTGRRDTTMLGPLVWLNGTACLAFVVGDGDDPLVVQMTIRGSAGADDPRTVVAERIASRNPRAVIRVFDDELRLAQAGEALWPARFKPIRQAIERDRAARGAVDNSQ